MSEEPDAVEGCVGAIIMTVIACLLVLFYVSTEYRLARIEKLLKLNPYSFTELFK